MRNTKLKEAQAGIKIARRNINHLRYADDTTLMAEREEELKSLLIKVKEQRHYFANKGPYSKSYGFSSSLYRLEKAMAPHSSTLAWKIPWTEEPGRLPSMGSLGSDTTERLHFHFSLSCIGEGNGNPLQCFCLENPGTGEPGRLPSMGSHRVGHD